MGVPFLYLPIKLRTSLIMKVGIFSSSAFRGSGNHISTIRSHQLSDAVGISLPSASSTLVSYSHQFILHPVRNFPWNSVHVNRIRQPPFPDPMPDVRLQDDLTFLLLQHISPGASGASANFPTRLDRKSTRLN